MELNVPVILRETAGIPRLQEPVTVGIPIPKGMLAENGRLSLIDNDQSIIPLQSTPLAQWPDGSIKWLLLDFQARIEAGQTKELSLNSVVDLPSLHGDIVSIDEAENKLIVDTGPTTFHIPTDTFKPFSQVLIGKAECLAGQCSITALIDSNGRESDTVISAWEWEMRGPIRSTVKITGNFLNSEREELLAFIARLSFFAGISTCKIDFTLWNPKAAVHSGGLWDLGDAGSFYFQDLSIQLFPRFERSPEIEWKETADASVESIRASNLLIYQDSSGGENWQSRNHVNRNNEVKTSFRGFKITSAGKEINYGLRAEPNINVSDGKIKISAVIQHFWQNFPKALEVAEEIFSIRFFPRYYNDDFELQGGERKTHTCFLDFKKINDLNDLSSWVHHSLEARSTPEWYSQTKAVPYLVPENKLSENQLFPLIKPAVEGKNTFFDRREIIDEYGWRNFGDWYADHEAIGHKGPLPLVAHYNNQYDGIFGTLCQYLKTGDSLWFILGNQLCLHVRDIDIYHTGEDRPEFNKGLFWHTEHYLDAKSSTHRCFSKKHAAFRNLTCYGGGPAISHNYASGCLLHYYLSGDTASKEAVLDLAEFCQKMIASQTTLTHFIVEGIRKAKKKIRKAIKGQTLVDLDKVYNMNGPGRGAGNALSTLLTSYELSKDEQLLHLAEEVIRLCVHPTDNIKAMDMLDIENRWMYTVFLQALVKYIDITSDDEVGDLHAYARNSLLHYARWMSENEYLYLEYPQKLEYPNETWAAQEIRKSNVFFAAAKYSNDEMEKKLFMEKGEYFYQGCLKQLNTYETRELTRPITILLQNSLIPAFFHKNGEKITNPFAVRANEYKQCAWETVRSRKIIRQLFHILNTSSVKREISYISSRIRKKPF